MTTPVIDPQGVILRIRTIVENEGSVPEVSRKCGIKQPTLEGIMRAQSLPNATTLAQLSHGLDVDAHWILFGKVFDDAATS